MPGFFQTGKLFRTQKCNARNLLDRETLQDNVLFQLIAGLPLHSIIDTAIFQADTMVLSNLSETLFVGVHWS